MIIDFTNLSLFPSSSLSIWRVPIAIGRGEVGVRGLNINI
jgi:hypothetical protein